ncbi:hypothetical protein BASA61_003452 [Batrachochytrium salamandrivorans]|nr:hypothetical protein BASA60_004764 [Batrachochytrium salamandrivorans]KAH6596548.1 hypothetical protein BASA61_003452 [Batrachochytrium salamandrivorans]KAH9272731.1 hypothetical protein BASA83_004933 [Batrachochytrium salamandrivorans]
MKLAIASTTILFAMMAAQATGFSVAPTTDVNLVKRTPNGDEDDEQSNMPGQSSSDSTSQSPLTESEEDQMENVSDALFEQLNDLLRLSSFQRNKIDEFGEIVTKLELACEGEDSPACTKVNVVVVELKEKISSLEEQLKITTGAYETKLEEQNEFKEAKSSHDYNHLRGYLQNE